MACRDPVEIRPKQPSAKGSPPRTPQYCGSAASFSRHSCSSAPDPLRGARRRRGGRRVPEAGCRGRRVCDACRRDHACTDHARSQGAPARPFRILTRRVATFGDLREYVLRDGWIGEPNLARGRARTGDHRRCRKELVDGTILRTKVPHGLRNEIGIDLFRHILRAQLRVTEEQFWAVVHGAAAAAELAPPGAVAIPGRLVERLLFTVRRPRGRDPRHDARRGAGRVGDLPGSTSVGPVRRRTAASRSAQAPVPEGRSRCSNSAGSSRRQPRARHPWSAGTA